MNFQTNRFTKIAVSGGLAAGLLLSPKLWTGDRAFPLAPIFDALPTLSYTAALSMYCALLMLIIVVAVLPRPRFFIIAAVLLCLVLVLFDQGRLQPWFCQYVFMLAALIPLRWNASDPGEENRERHARNTCRFIVASIFFYSGLQKLNKSFFTHIFPWMVGPLAEPLPEPLRSLAYIFGFLVPIIELFVGVGLLFPKTRRIAVLFGVSTMLFVLTILSPLVHNWNSIVWPWNVTMAMLTIILFLDAKSVRFSEIVNFRTPMFTKSALVVFGVLPLFSFCNLWDSYPSSALYSGNLNDADLSFGAQVYDALPEQVKKLTHKSKDERYKLNIADWSFKEVNVPAYPEARVFKKVFSSFCASYQGDGPISMIVHGRPSILRADEPETFSCALTKTPAV